MAGPIVDTVGHSNGKGETIKVSRGASKAARVGIAKIPAKTAIKPAAKPVAKAAPAKAATVMATPAAAVSDNLLLIKGIGPVNDRKLRAHGITSFAQIAAWKKADIISVEKYLEFDGRIAREDWMGQAKALGKAAKAKAAAKPAVKAAAVKAPAKPAALKMTPKPAVKIAPAKPAAKAVAKPVTKTAVKTAAAKPAVVKAPVKSAAKTVPAKSAAVKAAAKPAVSKDKAASPKPAAKPKAAAPAAKLPDDLLIIKGIGPVNLRKLNAHGITAFAQIAAWKKADIIAVEKYLEFDGRIAREDWIGQAKQFAKGIGLPKPKSSQSSRTGKAGGRK
jgi:branched-chain amino acid transport system ATP-binding protein